MDQFTYWAPGINAIYLFRSIAPSQANTLPGGTSLCSPFQSPHTWGSRHSGGFWQCQRDAMAHSQGQLDAVAYSPGRTLGLWSNLIGWTLCDLIPPSWWISSWFLWPTNWILCWLWVYCGHLISVGPQEKRNTSSCRVAACVCVWCESNSYLYCTCESNTYLYCTCTITSGYNYVSKNLKRYYLESWSILSIYSCVLFGIFSSW